ncbi:MDN1 [Symbiodinium sp. KB8]|nr:MDN1 [Symbiodinium sp. KB8]
MARILLVAILGLLRLSGAVDVKHQAVEASDARHASENHEEMEVQADGSAKAMMRREKGSEKEAGDPTQTTTVFEEGVGTDTTSGSSSGDEEEEGENEESLLRTDKELQRTKSDPDESEGSDEEESDEETTTTEQSDDSDDGDGLPEGEDLASTGSSKSTRSDETKDKAEKTKGEEDTEESDSDEESQGAEEDASDSMSSVEMEGFSTNAGPHHKAKAARSAGHPADRHSAPHSKVESRHREAPVKATAKHASGKHSADKQPEKHKVEAQTKAEIKSHATHKMQRKMLSLCYRRTFIDVDNEPSVKLSRPRSVPAGRRTEVHEDAQMKKDLASIYQRMEEWRSGSSSITDPVPEAQAKEPMVQATSAGGPSDETPAPEEPMMPAMMEGLPALNPGSYGHPEVCRKPCVFFQVGNCENGDRCGYCHVRHQKRPVLPDMKQRSSLRKLNQSELLHTFLPILWFEARRVHIAHEAAPVLKILEDTRSTLGEPRTAKLVGNETEYLQSLLFRMSFGSLMAMLLHNLQPSATVDAARNELEAMRQTLQFNA